MIAAARRRLPFIVLFVLLAGALGYTLVFRTVQSSVPSEPLAIELLAERALLAPAQRIAAAAAGHWDGQFTVTVAEVDSSRAVEMVQEGVLRIALVVAEEAPGRKGIDAKVVARLPVVIGVPALGPRPALDAAQAQALSRGDGRVALDLGQGPGAYTLLSREEFVEKASAGQLRPGFVAAVRMDDLGAQIAALAVDGVLPEPATVRDGTYPLSHAVQAIWAGNALSPISRVWVSLTHPGYRRAAEFTRWLESADATTAMIGVGELITLTAVGDVMLDRGVARWIERSGPDYPFEAVWDILARADITVCNLESPLGTGGRRAAGKAIFFQAKPEVGQGLIKAGFDAVSLANNHSVDYGREGLLECLDHLKAIGIEYFGGGRDLDEARRPAVLERGGLRVAFLGYSEFADMYWSVTERFSFEAGPDRPGVAPLRQPYRALSLASVEAANKMVAEDIAAARQGGADIVVASVHWGVEYEHPPSQFQRLAAQFMLDAGADIILGHHPHVVQGLWPSPGGGLVAYSLGNFVFDQPWPDTQESMILEIKLSSRGVFRWDFTPVQITACQPRPIAGEPEGARLWNKITTLSWDLY